jgi:hypothetical protein
VPALPCHTAVDPPFAFRTPTGLERPDRGDYTAKPADLLAFLREGTIFKERDGGLVASSAAAPDHQRERVATMADTTLPPSSPENLVLVQLLRAIDEVIDRLARVERELVGIRRNITNLHEDWAGMSVRLDNLDRRVARIEHRLDLVEEPGNGQA